MGIAIGVDLRTAGAKAMHAGALQASRSNTHFNKRADEKPAFEAQAFLNLAGVGRKVVEYGSKDVVFMQGDPATSVLYIQEGCVRLTFVNDAGKEAVVAVLGPGDLLGEGCLAGQAQRANTATTITPTRILVLEKPELIRVLHAERALSDWFIRRVLSRSIRVEQDLVDQRFNSAEKRLARALLLLAHYGEQGQPQNMLPKVSQEMLAEMIGTTRARVNFFMNKFRKLGLIEYDYNQEVHIDNSLLSILHHD